MKLSEAQVLAEQAIYDYTSSTKWQQVKYMTWTTAEMQDVIAKALVKNIEVIQCCTELKDKEKLTFNKWRESKGLYYTNRGDYENMHGTLIDENDVVKMYQDYLRL